MLLNFQSAEVGFQGIDILAYVYVVRKLIFLSNSPENSVWLEAHQESDYDQSLEVGKFWLEKRRTTRGTRLVNMARARPRFDNFLYHPATLKP